MNTTPPPSARRPLRNALATLMLALSPVAMALPAAPAQAQTLFGSPVTEAEILPGWRAPDGTRMAALRLRMAPGWHTYWRIPGDAGIAPRFDWSRSQNVLAIEPIWPRPSVFDQNGLRSFGYEGELVLPLRITARDRDRPMAIMGALSIGVCRDTCVPVDLQVSGALRGTGGADPAISASLDRRAEPADGLGLRRVTCRVEPATRGAELTLRATVPQIGPGEQIVMELPGSGYWISNSQTWREGSDLVAQARVRNTGDGPVGIDRSALAFTILTDQRMVFSRGCVGG